MVVTIGWTTSVSLLLFLVYGLYEQELHPVTAAAYSSFSHTLWALGLAWVVIACSTGYGGRILTVSHLNLGSFFFEFQLNSIKEYIKIHILFVSGFVNKVLSSTVLYPFSRVTYCAYLVHPILIRIFAMKMDSPIHLGKDLVVS